MTTDAGAARRRLPTARLILAAVVGAAIAVALAGQVHAPVGPFDTTVSARPSLHSASTIGLAPFGSIELDTHAGPVAIDLRVDELRPDEAERIVNDPTVLDRVENEVTDDARDALLSLLVRVVILGAIGGAAGALVTRRSWRAGLVGALTGTLLVGGLAAVTVASFQPRAVAEPRYSGLLTMAPSAIGDVESIVDQFDDYSAQLTELVANVATLYQAGRSLPDLDVDGDVVRVLHVSDIHNSPQAFDLIDQLVTQFDVDAVFDSGDTTDWGSEPEARLLGQIGRLDVPYVWVRGNHDSRRTQDAVAAEPNAIVLDGTATDVVGLRVWGIGDPRYTPDKDQATGQGVERDVAVAFAADVATELRRTARVDVVLVHDERIAAEVGAKVPLVLAGHTHRPREDDLDGATLLVEGSTGGAGLRGLQGDEPHPLTASILYFNPDTNLLVAYDRITVDGLGGSGVRIERHVLRAGAPDDG